LNPFNSQAGVYQASHHSWSTWTETKAQQTISSLSPASRVSTTVGPDGGTFGDLVILPLPFAADHTQIGLNVIDSAAWNSIDIGGKIVLTGREVRWNAAWQSTFVDKLTAQPSAAVVYTWWYDWMNFTPMLYSSTGGRPLGSPGGYYGTCTYLQAQ
jgi:hypothetical protein